MITPRPIIVVTSVAAIALAACGGGTAGDADDTTGEPTSTTVSPTTMLTTATITTTLPTPPTDTEMPAAPGRLIMQPGETYTAGRFWIPFALTVEDDGWWVRGVEETWAYLEYYGTGGSDQTRPDLGRILDLALVAHATEADPESILNGFIARDHIEVVSDLAMTTVDGRDTWFADVVNIDEGRPTSSGNACDDGGPHSAYWDPAPGVSMHTVIDPRDGTTAHLGVAGCRTGRIWAVDVDGKTIVIIAATTNPEFEDLVPIAERLVAGIEFES